MALVQRAIQRAIAYFHGSSTATPALSVLALNGAAAAPAPTSTPLLDAIWLAAPKSKVTPMRKKIRNNDPSKRLKNIVHFQDCPMCGEKKLRHRLCMGCFKKGKYFV